MEPTGQCQWGGEDEQNRSETGENRTPWRPRALSAGEGTCLSSVQHAVPAPGQVAGSHLHHVEISVFSGLRAHRQERGRDQHGVMEGGTRETME